MPRQPRRPAAVVAPRRASGWSTVMFRPRRPCRSTPRSRSSGERNRKRRSERTKKTSKGPALHKGGFAASASAPMTLVPSHRVVKQAKGGAHVAVRVDKESRGEFGPGGPVRVVRRGRERI